jgi:hypothetical protein
LVEDFQDQSLFVWDIKMQPLTVLNFVLFFSFKNSFVSEPIRLTEITKDNKWKIKDLEKRYWNNFYNLYFLHLSQRKNWI